MKCMKWVQLWQRVLVYSVNAARWGATLVVGFMILYYFLGGLVAVTSAIVNVIIVLEFCQPWRYFDFAPCRCARAHPRHGCRGKHSNF